MAGIPDAGSYAGNSEGAHSTRVSQAVSQSVPRCSSTSDILMPHELLIGVHKAARSKRGLERRGRPLKGGGVEANAAELSNQIR